MKRPLSLALAVSLLAASASATPKDADTLFREGRAAMKAGDYETACPKLEESYRLDPAAGTAVNLGDCFDKQGKVGSALLAYRAARDLLKPGDPRITPVAQQLAVLEKRVPKLTITLAPDSPEGTTVKRDGRDVELAELGKAVPLNPGEVVLEVSAPGTRAVRTKLVLGEGEAKHFVAEVEEPMSLPEQDRETPASAPPEHAETKTNGLVVGGLGVAAVVFGAVAFSQARQYEDDSKRAAAAGDDGSKKDKFATAERWNTTGIVAAVAGGAAIVTGAVLWLSADAADAPARGRGVGLSYSATLNTASLQLKGAW